MDSRRYCIICGRDISDHPLSHDLCYGCWKEIHGRLTRKNDYSNYSGDYNDSRDGGYNETYYERYAGDSEYDLGPDWDYDEFPPENL